MNRLTTYLAAVAVVLALLSFNGCAYFNTFYDVKKKFNEAEKETNSRRPADQQQQQQPGSPPGQGASTPPRQTQNVPIDKYQKVIQAASRLLEYYPKSRWIDDALLLMGISYYRIGDYSRAERKFTELMTIFPDSKLVGDAVIWKARTLLEQDRHEEATDLLGKMAPLLKQRRQRGQAEFLLARTEYDVKHWSEAATHFQIAEEMIGGGDERWEARHLYGICLFEQKDYAGAEKAFESVARSTRDRRRAYNAYLYTARCAVALGDTERAEKILLRLKDNSTFGDLADDVDLELAELAVQSGRVEEGIEIYNKYAEEHTTGEARGLAYFRLARIYRTHHVDLPQARALLDSVLRVGAARDVSDSARAMQDELTRGLLALDRVRALQDSLHQIDVQQFMLLQRKAGAASLPATPASTPDSASVADTSHVSVASTDTVAVSPQPSAAPDSSRNLPVASDTVAVLGDSTIASGTTSDTTSIAVVDSTQESRRVSPATLAADSIMRAIRQRLPQDTSAATHADTVLAARVPAKSDTAVADEMQQLARKQLQVQREYQLALLHVAEFYDLSLAEQDSALSYYHRAAALKANPVVYWKANLFLAERAGHDSAQAPQAQAYYQAVADADSVPLEVANLARKALGLPLLEVPPKPQEEAFRVAEQASVSNDVPPDSVIRLYGSVIAMDSTSAAAKHALFAQLYLYEHRLQNSDSALAVARRIIAYYPDSTFSERLKTRLLPPDSTSIFLLSDEELYKTAAVQDSIFEEIPTEGGWPPPEETLKGRRFE